MQIKDQIITLNKLLKKEFRQFLRAEEKEQAEISKEIFVLKETRTQLMHKIGLQTTEDIRHDKEFRGNNNDWIFKL